MFTGFAAHNAIFITSLLSHFTPSLCTGDAGCRVGSACVPDLPLECLAVACAKPAPALPLFPLSPLAQAMQAVGEGRRPPEQGTGSVPAYGWLAGAAAVALAAFALGTRLASRS